MKKIHKHYSGLTLVEMIVAIGIFSLAMVGITLLFAKSWEINSYIYETGQDSFAASRTVNFLVDNLRKIRQADNGDYSIKSADDLDLVIYLDIDQDEKAERIHYFLDQDTDELKVGIREPSSSMPPTYLDGDDTVQVAASHVVNDADHPIFFYYGNEYFTNLVPFDTPVASGEINRIKIIKVSLLVDVRPYHSPDHVLIESFAQPRNLKDYEQ